MRRLLIGLIVLVLLGLAVFWFLTMPGTVPVSALGPHTPNADNGRTMFLAGGCASCHATPNQTDGTRLGGGLGLKSPFGTFYVPNISPHPRDGIGAWNEAQFVTAMSQGTSPGGSHYYPSFPYTSFHLMSVGDQRDLLAYLRTLPAIEGVARPHDLPFPFTFRRGLGLWKLLFLREARFQPNPAQSPQWNRGAYLANALTHCAECHSPRNFMGGIIESQRFAGGPNPEGEGWIPNITQARLKDWSEGDIEFLLATGQLPDGDSVGGQMAAVVRNTSQLSDDDRKAIARYIKGLPAVQGPARPAK
jgi:mono/diheme cytochrome c family protein